MAKKKVKTTSQQVLIAAQQSEIENLYRERRDAVKTYEELLSRQHLKGMPDIFQERVKRGLADSPEAFRNPPLSQAETEAAEASRINESGGARVFTGAVGEKFHEVKTPEQLLNELNDGPGTPPKPPQGPPEHVPGPVGYPSPLAPPATSIPTVALRGPRFVTIRRQAERPLGFPPIRLPKGGSVNAPTSATVFTRVETLYRGRRLFLGAASTGNNPLASATEQQVQTILSMANVIVLDIKVGKDSQLAAAEPLPASMFCPISTGVDMNFETAKTGALISLILGNVGKEAVTLHAGMNGKEIWFETGELVEPDWEAVRALTEEYKKEARSEAFEKEKLVNQQLSAKVRRLETEKEDHNRRVREINREMIAAKEEKEKAEQAAAAAATFKGKKNKKPGTKPGK